MKSPKTPFSPCSVLNHLLTATELITYLLQLHSDICSTLQVSKCYLESSKEGGQVPWKPVGVPPFPWEYLEVLR